MIKRKNYAAQEGYCRQFQEKLGFESSQRTAWI
jgi:hypothetical protein